MGINLCEKLDESEEEDTPNIKVNEEYAQRFAYNKKREDLQRLEELKKRGCADDSEESSSEMEEEDDSFFSAKKELQFCEALVKVKKKDPSLYQKDVKLFDSEDEDDEEAGGEEKLKDQKEKPVFLKHALRKRLIEEGPELEEEPEETETPAIKSYSENQEELRRAFFAAEEASEDDEGDLMAEKMVTEPREMEHVAEDCKIERRLNEYFGADSVLDENEMFLKNFFQNKAWIDKDRGRKPTHEELFGVSEDEDELDKQDKYEAEYNFRYEENAGDRVLGHARFSEETVRKKSNARMIQRKSKEERMAQAEFERKEELKRLKNVKKREIMEKLEKILSIAGIAEGRACTLNEEDLEEEFDPEEFDKKMKETFNEDYYEADDADRDFQCDGIDDLEKPDFDKEDELLGLPKNWDLLESGDGFLAAREKIRKRKLSKLGVDPGNENYNEGEGVSEVSEGKKQKIKGRISLQEKVALDKELEEYYKLDYEDTIGDLKTRFKYTSVPPNRYGLSAAEILMTDDQELNEYVSLKKLAPYRQSEYKVSKQKRFSQKMRMKLALQRVKSNTQKVKKKRHVKDNCGAKTSGSGSASEGKTKSEEQNGENGTLSRRSRRRRRQAALKISQSRLMAYGKIPPKSKIRKKH